MIRLQNKCMPLLFSFCLLAGCANPAEQVNVDKSKWFLSLKVHGQTVTLPLDVMYVHLTDNDAYPESFEIKGPAVNLVGEFPLTLRIDYMERWEKTLFKEIKILNRVRADYYWIEGPSTINLPGAPRRYISSGSFTVRKISGKMQGLNGDITLSGDIILNISVGDDIEKIIGTFSVHGVSLG